MRGASNPLVVERLATRCSLQRETDRQEGLSPAGHWADEPCVCEHEEALSVEREVGCVPSCRKNRWIGALPTYIVEGRASSTKRRKSMLVHPDDLEEQMRDGQVVTTMLDAVPLVLEASSHPCG